MLLIEIIEKHFVCFVILFRLKILSFRDVSKKIQEGFFFLIISLVSISKFLILDFPFFFLIIFLNIFLLKMLCYSNTTNNIYVGHIVYTERKRS